MKKLEELRWDCEMILVSQCDKAERGAEDKGEEFLNGKS